MLMIRLVLCLFAIFASPSAWSTEVCRYSGTTSHSGRVTVDTVASTVSGETTVDVTAWIEATTLALFAPRYLHQEITLWRRGEPYLVAVNHRYALNGSIRRQQWDVFTRGPEGITARRVQAKTLRDFQVRHPGFIRHWDPASFGQPWLRDYPAAAPERRADLDLPRTAMAPGLGTPLAMAFYWVRWSSADKAVVPMFLPGFKKDARIDILLSLADVDANGLRHMRLVARHPQLSQTDPSLAEAWVSPDHRLIRVTFDAHGHHGSAHGELRLERCEGPNRDP